MALEGIEWVIILVVIAAIIFWGPKKIPELAKSIGEARHEFSKASKESSKSVSSQQKDEDMPNDDVLIETARKLGINTLGKTRDEIAKEIVDKYGTKKRVPSLKP